MLPRPEPHIKDFSYPFTGLWFRNLKIRCCLMDLVDNRVSLEASTIRGTFFGVPYKGLSYFGSYIGVPLIYLHYLGFRVYGLSPLT